MKTLLMVVFVLLFTLPAPAQDAEEKKEEGQDYYVEVEDEAIDSNAGLTPTKLPVSLLETPASVGVVTGNLLQTQAASYLGDALLNISGVNVQSGFGTFDFFLIRGLDSLSNSLVLTDGAAEPEVTFYQIYNIDRVEVLKGPGAFLYGGNPLSGTVHLVRKQPLFRNGFDIQNSYGSFQSYRGTVDLNIANQKQDLAFRVNGLWETSNNFRDAKDNDLVAVNPAFTWRIDNRSFFNVNFEYVQSEYKPDAGLPIINNSLPDIPRERSYQTPFDISRQDVYRTRFDYEIRMNDKLTLRNKFYYTDLDWRSNGTLFAATVPAGPSETYIIRTQPRLNDRQKLTGNQFEAIYSLTTGNLKHKLLTGFEVSQLSDVFTLDVAFLPPIGVFQPVETATPNAPLIPGLSQKGDARSIVAAPYFVDQISLNEQMDIFVGGRVDFLDYEDTATSTTRDETQFSPLVGFVFSPQENFSLYVNGGRGFAAPSTLVSGERKPEEITQFEAGAKQVWMDGRLKTSVAVYHLDKENIAIPDDNGITQQAGNIRSRGVEFELAGSPSRNWETYVTYAFNDAELTSFKELIFTGQVPPFVILDRTGNDPAFAPHHIFNVWVLHDFSDRIRAGGGPRIVGSQFIAEDNVYSIDSYATLDAYFACSFDNWRVSLNFKNLTDTAYETRGFGSTSVIPADPFAVYVGVDFKL